MLLKNSENLKTRLKKAAAEKDEAQRGVKIAAVIAEALRQIDQDPVLVGGAAVEFYTEGEYTTGDIDMIAPGGPELWEIMRQLGFERIGKDYIHKKLGIYIEFPGEELKETETSNILDVDGTPLQIISIEDLVIDRLCAYKFWESSADGLATLWLLEVGNADPTLLNVKAEYEDVLDALKNIQNVYEEVFRKKITRQKASNLIREWLQTRKNQK